MKPHDELFKHIPPFRVYARVRNPVVPFAVWLIFQLVGAVVMSIVGWLLVTKAVDELVSGGFQ